MKTLALLLALALQQPQTIRINYVNADLGDVIRSLATVLGVNVVLTDVPSRRITFQTPEPVPAPQVGAVLEAILESQGLVDRKSTRLNSSHLVISYAVFCLKKKKKNRYSTRTTTYR